MAGWLPVVVAGAQEPPLGESATQPSPGGVVVKEAFRFDRLELNNGPRYRRYRVNEYTALTTVNVGVTRDFSLSFRAPAAYRREKEARVGAIREDIGAGDVTLLGKWRFFQRDTGPIDTVRAAVLGGAEIRTGDTPFTSDSYDPVLGLAFTQIIGRHGINASTLWKFTTDGGDRPVEFGGGRADAWRYDAAYLYRIYPAEYTVDTPGALYVVGEMNGRYETNGDNELLAAPGLMWEAAHWVLELSVQAPVRQDVAHRAETKYAIMLGFRVSF